MHIVFLNPQGNFDPTDFKLTEHPDFGGQLVYVKEVSLALGQLGHRVDIATRKIVDPLWPPFSGDLDGYPGHPQVRILRFPCGPPQFLPKEQLWPHLSEWAEHILTYYQQTAFPDIFTAHYGDGGIAAALLRHKTGIPFTFTAHSLGAQKIDKLIHNREAFHSLVEKYAFDIRIAAERAAMAHASRIIVSTRLEQQEQYGHRLYQGAVDPDDADKFAIIPPGVNLKIFGADQKAAAETAIHRKVARMIHRDILPERQNLPFVIASSRLDRKKNQLTLVKAWAENPQLKQSANLILIIRGSENPWKDWQKILSGEEQLIFREILQVIDAHQLRGTMCFFALNSQSELAACYRYLATHKRGIFALTSIYEPFGLAPLEAMAAGLPVVVTRNGGPSESLRDEDGIVYGILVDPTDPRDVARGILQLVQNEEIYRDFRMRGRQRILDKYTWEKTARGYVAVFQRIREGKDRANMAFPIPGYFFNENEEDILRQWLEEAYFGESG